MRYEIEVNIERIIAEHVLRYSATIVNIDKYTAEGFSKCDNKYKVLTRLPHGKYTITHNNTDLEIDYTINNDILLNTGNKVENLFIRSDTNLEDIYSFIEKARLHSLNYKSDKVTCRVMKKGYWSELSSLPKRPIDSVILGKEKINDILSDIDNFINSEDEYLDKGIPYKRNYLLEGKPGTGKTSLIFAIASHLDMDLCIMNFSFGLDDINFMDAISNMNDKSILVLEDIDRVFGTNSEKKCNISFGGILNILDGIGRKHKLITFMTTNFMEQLDKALLRPGRIDYKLSFDYNTQEQTELMYSKLINNYNQSDCKKFSDKINTYNFTTATLQKYLFKYRNDSLEKILMNIDEFIELCDDKDASSTYLYM